MQHTNRRYKSLTQKIKDYRNSEGWESQTGPHPVLVTPEELWSECNEFSQKYGIGPGYVGVIMDKLDEFKKLDPIDAGELIHAIWMGFNSANAARYEHGLDNMLDELADTCRKAAKSKNPSYIRHQREVISKAVEKFVNPKECIETIINAVRSTYEQ